MDSKDIRFPISTDVRAVLVGLSVTLGIPLTVVAAAVVEIALEDYSEKIPAISERIAIYAGTHTQPPADGAIATGRKQRVKV